MGKVTYRIDRILSNQDTLELGLKKGVNFKIISNGANGNILQSATLLKYESGPTTFSFGASGTETAFKLDSSNLFYSGPNEDVASALNLIPNVGFVQAYVKNQKNYIFNHLHNNFLSPSANGKIAIVSAAGDSETNPKKEIRLQEVYSAADNYSNVSSGNEEPITFAYDATTSRMSIGEIGSASSHFITGIVVDAYGKIVSYQSKKVSTSDLNFSASNIDNYRAWNVNATGNPSVIGQVISGYANMDATTPTSVPGVTFAATSPLVSTLSVDANTQTNTVTYALNYDSNVFETDQSGYFTLTTITDVSTGDAGAALYNITIDGHGRVKSKSAVTSSQITDLVSNFSTSQKGIVLPKGNDNTETATADTTFFLTSSGKWASLPIGKVQVAAVSSGATHYPLLASADTDISTTANRTAVANASAYITGGGVIYATGFNGNGSQLTDIDVGNLSGGSGNHKIATNLLNIYGTGTSLLSELGLSGIRNSSVTNALQYQSNRVLYTTSAGAISVTADSVAGTEANVAGVAVLAADYGTDGKPLASSANIGWRNIKSLVTQIVAGEGGMRFMGVLGNGTAGTVTWQAAEASFKKGDFYKVGTDDLTIYTGFTGRVQAGDTIFAVADKDVNDYTTNPGKYWTIIQGNVDNPVTMNTTTDPVANTAYNVVLVNPNAKTAAYAGLTATIVDSVYELNATADKAKSLVTTRTLWGQDFNGSANVSGAITGAGTITPAATNTHTLGTEDVVWKEAWINDVHGKASTAGTADKVANALSIKLGNSSAEAITYDGSASTEVVIDIDTLNLFDSFENASATGNGNVVTGVTLSRGTEANVSKLICTVDKSIVAVTGLSSNIFSITGGANTATPGIAFLSDPAGQLAFYTGSNEPVVSGAQILRLWGNLHANSMKVAVGSGMKNVAHETDANPSNPIFNRPLLVADTTPGNNVDYGFTSSGVSIANSLSDTNGGSTNVIPNEKAIVTYVANTATAISASTKVEALKFSFSETSGTPSSGKTISENSVIDHIDVVIGRAFSSSTVVKIKNGNTILISTAAGDTVTEGFVDLEEGNSTFTYKPSAPVVGSGGFTLSADISNAPSSGEKGNAVCYVYYTKSQV